jgi:hypothetical protein
MCVRYIKRTLGYMHLSIGFKMSSNKPEVRAVNTENPLRSVWEVVADELTAMYTEILWEGVEGRPRTPQLQIAGANETFATTVETEAGCTVESFCAGCPVSTNTFPPGTWPLYAPRRLISPCYFCYEVRDGDAVIKSYAIPYCRTEEGRAIDLMYNRSGRPYLYNRGYCASRTVGGGEPSHSWTVSGGPLLRIEVVDPTGDVLSLKLFGTPQAFRRSLGVSAILLAEVVADRVITGAGTKSVVRIEFGGPPSVGDINDFYLTGVTRSGEPVEVDVQLTQINFNRAGPENGIDHVSTFSA